ncbi:sensor histidine kinase [Kangiella sediminilitoris]|uniref:histidine kinase n=1 Tax=Kangiella sediminilitoris TaxID=1144748 RepID=A0A1B3B847_9GAMM|nr:HAMP domain-containing sensor histidine kinase [Kangiella sediminilitoris]AOE48972.1 Histidine kinase [Kangiella sediminilitoris]
MGKKQRGIHHKLIRAMAIQLVLISGVTLLSVYGAGKVVEKVLIKEALDGEAEFYWSHYKENPDFNLPSTLNLTGYMESADNPDSVPEDIARLPIGYQRLETREKRPLVHVSEKYGKRLYLVFEEGQVARLALFFGITPLALVLMIIYLPAWISYLMAKRAVSPVIKLSRKMETVDGDHGFEIDFSDIEENADAEVKVLLDAFRQYAHKVSEYIEREKNFTRYASHELRTPLAVLKGSLAVLDRQSLESRQQAVVDRMRPMIKEMEDLLEALLLLSREQKPEVSKEPIVLNELVSQQVRQIQKLNAHKQITVLTDYKNSIERVLPERLFCICINNIISNAFNYTENGTIKITIEDSSIIIEDTGCGIPSTALKRIYEPFYRVNRDSSKVKGFGLGLSIVYRICEQMDWKLTIESVPEEGTKVSLVL